MKKVMVFGTFDILHKGHLDFLKQAKRHGDFLVVVVARDKTVLAIKKRKSLQDEKARLREIVRSGLADKALLGNIRDQYRIIQQVKPSVICLGYDQRHFADNLGRELRGRRIEARIVRLKPYMAHKYKSSKLRESHASGKQKNKADSC
jgi:FAD synthetase